MTSSSHIRRIALIAVIGCAILVRLDQRRRRRPDLTIPTLPIVPATPHHRADARARSGDSIDFMLPIDSRRRGFCSSRS